VKVVASVIRIKLMLAGSRVSARFRFGSKEPTPIGLHGLGSGKQLDSTLLHEPQLGLKTKPNRSTWTQTQPRTEVDES
jgi:hypothetical protein